MNISYYTSEFTSQVAQISPSSIPGTLWAYYIEYLWNYESDSWVARIAYSCRVLAILVSLPLLILGMLDITSYAIARTLGVVDDTKASTSDKATVHVQNAPSIRIEGVATPSSDSTFSDSDRDSLGDHTLRDRIRSPLSDSISVIEAENETNLSLPPVFYAGDDTNLKLSGVGVFSPAGSQPPSPTLSRNHLPQDPQSENLRYRGQQSAQIDDA